MIPLKGFYSFIKIQNKVMLVVRRILRCWGLIDVFRWPSKNRGIRWQRKEPHQNNLQTSERKVEENSRITTGSHKQGTGKCSILNQHLPVLLAYISPFNIQSHRPAWLVNMKCCIQVLNPPNLKNIFVFLTFWGYQYVIIAKRLLKTHEYGCTVNISVHAI